MGWRYRPAYCIFGWAPKTCETIVGGWGRHTIPVAAGGKYLGLAGSASAKVAQIQGMEGLEGGYPAFAPQEPPVRATANSKCG